MFTYVLYGLIWQAFGGFLVCLTVCLYVHMSDSASVHPSVYPYVHWSVHMSKYVCMSIHPLGKVVWLYIHLYFPWGIWEDVSVSVRHPCVYQYSHLSTDPPSLCLHLWIYRCNVGCSFHHSAHSLYNKHAQY